MGGGADGSYFTGRQLTFFPSDSDEDDDDETLCNGSERGPAG